MDTGTCTPSLFDPARSHVACHCATRNAAFHHTDDVGSGLKHYRVQSGVASEGGSGTPVPNVSIEVSDIDEVLDRAKSMDLPIEYGPVSEPWGIRRFYIRDPNGTLLKTVSHEETGRDPVV